MKFPSFVRLFGERWFGGGSPRKPRRKSRRLRGCGRSAPLTFDHLEDRTLLATLPSPTVLGQTMIAQGGGDRSNPQIAVDPLDPQRAVSVWFDRILPVPTSPPRVVAEGAFTTNGGQTWLNFFLPPNLIDPGSSPM